MENKSPNIDFSLFFENSIDMLCIADTKGFFIKLNPEWEKTLGYPLSELEGKPYLKYVHPDDVAETTYAAQQLANGGKINTLTNRYRHRDGSYRWIEWRSFSLNSIIYACARDITDRIEQKEALKRSEDKYRLLFENMTSGFALFEIIYDNKGKILDYRFIEANPAFEKQTGLSVTLLIGNTYKNIIPDTYNFWLTTFEEIAKTGKPVNLVYYSTETHKSYDTYAFIFEKNKFAIVFNDITDRVKAEKELKLTEEKFSLAFKTSPDGVIISRLSDGVFMEVNDGFYSITGYNTEEVIGKSSFEIDMWVNPDERSELIKRLKKQGKATNLEVHLRCKNGNIIVALMSAVIITLQGIKCILSITRDISERKRDEEQIRRSEERLHKAQSIGHIGFSEQGIFDKELWASSEAMKIYGFPPVAGYLSVDKIKDCIVDLPPFRKAYLELIEKGKRFDLEFAINPADGSPQRYIHGVAEIEKDEYGKPTTKFLTIIQDITKHKKTETQLQRNLNETRVRFKISQALAGKETEEEVLDALIQNAGLYRQAHMSILTFDRTESELAAILRRQDVFKSGLKSTMPIGTRFTASNFTGIKSLSADKPVILNDVLNEEGLDSASYELFSSGGVGSYGIFPISNGEEWMGYIGVSAKNTGYFNDENTHLYQTLAEQGAVALQTARLRDSIYASQQRFQALVETLNEIVWEIDEKGCYTYISPKIYDVLGYKTEEILGKTPFDLMTPEDAKRMKSIFVSQMGKKEPLYSLENINLHKDGRIVILDTSGVPFFDNEGQYKGYRGIDRDITGRKRAEEKFIKLASLHQTILDTVSAGLIFIKERNTQWVNKAITGMFGYEYNELIGESALIYYGDEEMYKKIGAEAYPVLSKGETFFTELTGKKKDGTLFWCQLFSKAVNPDDLSEGSIWIVTDISEKKMIEEKLRLTQFSIDYSSSNNLWVDEDAIIVYVNDAECKSLGYTREELIGLTAFDIDPDFSREGWNEHKAKLKIQKRMVFESRHRRKDGQVFPVEVTTNFINYKGKFFACTIDKDISDIIKKEEEIKKLNIELEKKVTERTEQLRQAYSDLETFSYSISHDLRTPLRHIDGFIRIMYSNIHNPIENVTKYYNRIITASKRMSTMIDDLLTFSRLGRKNIKKGVIDTNLLINDIIEQFKPDYSDRNIIWKIQKIPKIYADESLMRIAFENLISNAIKYTSKTTEPIIEIGTKQEPDDDYNTIYIKDNGAGFNMDYKDKLFGVFQRLHSPEEFEGTGIGLANVKQIITKHGGKVKAESTMNQGATFYVLLPKNK